jgi:hypothetical protein
MTVIAVSAGKVLEISFWNPSALDAAVLTDGTGFQLPALAVPIAMSRQSSI